MLIMSTSNGLPHPLPEEGLAIPVRASFTVLKSFPLIAVATNHLAPKLILFADKIECRVILMRRRRYEDIESVDAFQKFGTHNLILCWRGRSLAFSANLGKEETLIAVLRFFRARGNLLAERARKLLAARLF